MYFNYDFKTTDEFLTKSNLESFLRDFVRDTEIVRDKKVPGSRILNRPDFRIEELKLILEFNGKFHYTTAKTIMSDTLKKRIYINMGYRIISIPYWIQMKAEVIYHIFGQYEQFDKNKFIFRDFNNYNHGFNSEKCPLPCDYCELGIQYRFIKKIICIGILLLISFISMWTILY